MIRLDKYLCDMGKGTRSEVRTLIKKGLVCVGDLCITKPEHKFDENTEQVTLNGQPLVYQKYHYYMLNKPAGVVSATRDQISQTVLELLGNPECKNLFPVGRLDKDTEGLLLITNDGPLAHELLSPKKHVNKTYLVQTEKELSDEDIKCLEEGVDIGEEQATLPAQVEVLSPKEILLTIREGKYHQIKRMLQAVDNQVCYLKRLSMGPLRLDETLVPGEFRTLTEQEICALKNPTFNMMQDIKAVIFDLDGTLVDSMWMWYDIDVEYLGRYGLACPDDLQTCIEGMSFQETAVYFKQRFALPDSLEQIKSDWNQMAWDKYLHQVPLKEGAYDFLCHCRENGILLGIATSNSRELVENIAEVHGLNEFFGCIMTGSDVKKGKPAPDIYLAVAKGLGVLPERCLVFEDIVPGILAGKNAGMRVCAVEDIYSEHQRKEKRLLADYYIKNYRGIV